MSGHMNSRHETPTTPIGRVLHDLARRDVPDDRDLRAQVMTAIQHQAADRASDAATERAWNLPALDPARRHRRVSTPDTTEEQSMSGTPMAPRDEPIPFQQRRWSHEALKFAAAVIAIGIISLVLILALRDGDSNDNVIVPGATTPAPSTATAAATATVEPTATLQSTATTEATATVDATAAAEAQATTIAQRPSPGEISATIAVGRNPLGMAATDGSIWVTNGGDGTVSRIDAATNTVVATITVGKPGGPGPGGSPSEIEAFDGQVWVMNNFEEELVRIDPATNEVAQTITIDLAARGDPDSSLVVDETGIWVSDTQRGQLLHIDPATGATLAEIAMITPNGMASGFGSIWVLSGPSIGIYHVLRVDPTSGEVVSDIPVEVVEGITIVAGEDAVWVSDWGSGSIFRIDPTTNALTATFENPLGTSHSVAATSDGLWVSSLFAPGVARIDPATNESSRLIDEDNGGGSCLLAFDGSIWSAHPDDDAAVVVRIDPAP